MIWKPKDVEIGLLRWATRRIAGLAAHLLADKVLEDPSDIWRAVKVRVPSEFVEKFDVEGAMVAAVVKAEHESDGKVRTFHPIDLDGVRIAAILDPDGQANAFVDTGAGFVPGNVIKLADPEKVCTEECCECGEPVAQGSGKFTNRVPVCDDYFTRLECGRPHPIGGWLCEECDATVSTFLLPAKK